MRDGEDHNAVVCKGLQYRIVGKTVVLHKSRSIAVHERLQNVVHKKLRNHSMRKSAATGKKTKSGRMWQKAVCCAEERNGGIWNYILHAFPETGSDRKL